MSNKKDTKTKKIILKISLTLFVCSVMIFVLLKKGNIANIPVVEEVVESS